MSESVVAKRYAEALFQLGEEKNTLDQLVDEFQLIKDIFNDNEQMVTFLKHPRIKEGQKKQIIQEVFKEFHVDVLNTILLLVERQRIDIAPSIVDHFISLVNDAKGIAEATVYSVRELSSDEKKALEGILSKRFGKKAIKFDNVVDPAIL